MDLKTLLKPTFDRIDALTLRERVLIFIAGVAVLYLVVIMGLIQPLARQEMQIAQKINLAHQNIAQTDASLNSLISPAVQAQDQAQLAHLQQRVHHLQKHLGATNGAFVPPRDMVGLVRGLLVYTPGVVLVRLVNKPAIPIRKSPKGPVLAYRHVLSLVIRGRYPAIVHYLTLLAQRRPRVLWGRFSLTATYPYSTVHLRVYTLSLQQALLR